MRWRRRAAGIESAIAALRHYSDADMQPLRDEIDELFEIRSSREEIRRFYRTVGLVEDQAASE